jgi:hypothetical protein
LKNVLGMLKGSDKYETAENLSLLGVLIGALLLSAGIGLTVISSKGFPVVITMMGSLIAFLSTIILIFMWVIRDFTK